MILLFHEKRKKHKHKQQLYVPKCSGVVTDTVTFTVVGNDFVTVAIVSSKSTLHSNPPKVLKYNTISFYYQIKLN